MNSKLVDGVFKLLWHFMSYFHVRQDPISGGEDMMNAYSKFHPPGGSRLESMLNRAR